MCTCRGTLYQRGCVDIIRSGCVAVGCVGACEIPQSIGWYRVAKREELVVVVSIVYHLGAVMNGEYIPDILAAKVSLRHMLQQLVRQRLLIIGREHHYIRLLMIGK